MPRKQRPNDEAHRFADRLEALETEKRTIQHSITDLRVECVDAGLPWKALKEAVKRRLETPEAKSQRVEYEASLADILGRLGMFADTPLGSAAITRLHPVVDDDDDEPALELDSVPA